MTQPDTVPAWVERDEGRRAARESALLALVECVEALRDCPTGWEQPHDPARRALLEELRAYSAAADALRPDPNAG